MTTQELFKRVTESLKNADDNGYPSHQWASWRVAEELQTFDADLEDIPTPILAAVVRLLRWDGEVPGPW